VLDLMLSEFGDAVRLAGFHALDSLRLEKGFRHFGHDIGEEDTPFAAGLGFAVALDKAGGFIGCEALLRAREVPAARRLVQFRLADPAPLLHHDEPIVMDGQRIGLLTSGSYGHTLGSALGMGWVAHPDGVDAGLLQGARFEIEIAGERYPAHASLRPFYDPAGLRMRG
jgi:4-methylaminobutanoate oxidase (formaldehyde-forming)